MPVFSKGLLCTRASSRPGRGGHRPGCPGGSDEDEADNSPDVANSSAVAPADQEGNPSNTEFEIEQNGLSDCQEEDFLFLLTLADRQLPEAEVELAPLVEFEHADLAELPPQLQPRKSSTAAAAAAAKKPPPPKRAVAKSSCGKATSDEDEEATSEEEPSAAAADVEPPLPLPPQLLTLQRTPVPPPDEDDKGKEEFLVLLTGLLAHGPPPPDDFRFFLTVCQSEVTR